MYSTFNCRVISFYLTSLLNQRSIVLQCNRYCNAIQLNLFFLIFQQSKEYFQLKVSALNDFYHEAMSIYASSSENGFWGGLWL